jgi:hypothetical protein
LEISAAGCGVPDQWRLGAAGLDFRRGDIHAAGAFIERKCGDEANRFDAGYSRQALHERVLKARHGGAVVQLGAAGGDLEREDILRVVARVDVTEPPEAAHEERGADQQDDGARSLCGHQHVAHVTAAADDASPGVLETAQPRARQADRGRQTERTCRQN